MPKSLSRSANSARAAASRITTLEKARPAMLKLLVGDMQVISLG